MPNDLSYADGGGSKFSPEVVRSAAQYAASIYSSEMAKKAPAHAGTIVTQASEDGRIKINATGGGTARAWFGTNKTGRGRGVRHPSSNRSKDPMKHSFASGGASHPGYGARPKTEQRAFGRIAQMLLDDTAKHAWDGWDPNG